MGFDFGVGYSELLVLAVIAVIVIGPKDLPKVLRVFGQFMRKARGMASEFQGHVDAAMKESGVDGLKKDLADIKTTVSKSVAAPGGIVPASPLSPSSTYSLTSSAKDFDAYFGAGAQAGETRVAGNKIVAAGDSAA
jgi:sec-independent protein translocase protein TatB